MGKQTPRQFLIPKLTDNLGEFARELGFRLSRLVTNLRNDLDNGATTLTVANIAGIANVSELDFDPGQQRIYVDTDDSDKVYLCVRVGAAVKTVELT